MWQQNAYGFRHEFDVGLNFTGSTDVWIRIRRPSGTFIERSLLVSDIVDIEQGFISVLFIQGDLTELGSYHIQMFDKTPGRFIPSGIVRFTVEANL